MSINAAAPVAPALAAPPTPALDALEAEGPILSPRAHRDHILHECVLTGQLLTGLGIFYRYYVPAWPMLRKGFLDPLNRRLCDAMIAEYQTRFPDLATGGDLNPQPEDDPTRFVLDGARDALLSQGAYGSNVRLITGDMDSDIAVVDDELIRGLIAIGLQWDVDAGVRDFLDDPAAALSIETPAEEQGPQEPEAEHYGGYGHKGYYRTPEAAEAAERGRRQLGW